VLSPLAPLRLGLRALDDLHHIALAATDIGPRLASLQDRADSIEEMLGEAIEVAREIEARGREAIVAAERIDERFQAILALADHLDERAGEVLAEAEVIRLVAADVALRGGQVAEAIPLLQRAVEIAEPLESTVERLGRLVDRLPGGLRAARPSRSPGGSTGGGSGGPPRGQG
jgi:methyl-accepting chemotaxis protein